MKSNIIKQIVSVVAVISFLPSFGQTGTKSYLSNRYSLERMGTVNAASNGVIPGLPLPPPDLVGDPFLNKHYAEGNFLLYNDQLINGIHSKLDLLQNTFNLRTDKGVRMLAGDLVKSFTFQDSLTKKVSTFINGREFKSESGSTLIGFFEIIHDAPFALIKKTEAYIVKSNYNATLNVGNRDHKVKKSIQYYYLKDGLVTLLPIKSTTKIFGERKAEIDGYIKTNKLSLKDERHLKLLFEYYNQLPGS